VIAVSDAMGEESGPQEERKIEGSPILKQIPAVILIKSRRVIVSSK
jgi:hypothetical protein